MHGGDTPHWTLETWCPDDMEALFDIHRRAMGPYVDQVWGWDDGDQRQRFGETLKPHVRKIVVDGATVGMLDVNRMTEAIFIGNIELVPEAQGHGIGSSILTSLLAEAGESGIRLTLQVLRVNDRARRLYESLGFHVTDQTATHLQMERSPQRDDYSERESL